MVSSTRVERFELPDDHPGVHDVDYLARRAAIADVARLHRSGEPIADVTYTPDEDRLWRTVSRELARKHERLACREYLVGAKRLALPGDRVPQLRELDERLDELSGFHLEPVAGLVPTRTFYGALARRTFLSTQYVRHHSVPFYTPEPDIVHEIIGHVNALANPAFAELYVAAGRASERAESDAAHEFFSRVFWFSLEFGVVLEEGAPKAFGAGLLSSYGELDVFHEAEIRPFDVVAMGTLDYDITHYQPVLFAGESFGRLVGDLTRFFYGYDDAAFCELMRRRG